MRAAKGGEKMRLACNARNIIGWPAAILGLVGDNFAAGKSGGMAYVWDPADRLAERINVEMLIFQAPWCPTGSPTCAPCSPSTAPPPNEPGREPPQLRHAGTRVAPL